MNHGIDMNIINMCRISMVVAHCTFPKGETFYAGTPAGIHCFDDQQSGMARFRNDG